jgi:hypothetical protein
MSLPSPVAAALTLLADIANHYAIDALCTSTHFAIRANMDWDDVVEML